MLMNIFSTFDPIWFNLCYKNTFTLILPLLLIFSIYWFSTNQNFITLIPILKYSLYQLMKTKLKLMKSSLYFMTSLFILILYMNITGMFPYLFSVTSQIIFTLSFGLPMWFFSLISSWVFSIKKSIAHLLPDSAPLWLNPFLIMIEFISIMVRPLTLSFRLTANMTAGHVVLTLISSFSISLTMKKFLLMMIFSMFYIIFELGICLIQAYIFCLLISLYSNDHV